MRINGKKTKTGEEILSPQPEPKKKKKEKAKVTPNKEKNTKKIGGNVFSKAYMANKMYIAIALVIALVSLIILMLSAVNAISNNIKYSSAMKNIDKLYSQDMVNNNVFANIEIYSARVLSYSDGICETDFGSLECAEPTTPIIFIFRDLDGTLKLFDNSINEGKQFSYVTSNFNLSDNDFLITEATEKQVYSTYLNDLNAAKELKSKADQYAKRIIISAAILVTSLLSAFILYKLLLIKVEKVPLVNNIQNNTANINDMSENNAGNSIVNDNGEDAEFDDI